MDIVQTTRVYELTYLLSGSLTDNEAAQVKSEVDQLLKKYKAEVIKTEDWGRKQLAYIITHEGKKNTEGIYVHIAFRLVSEQAPILERELYLSSKLMRHLMLVAEDQAEETASK